MCCGTRARAARAEQRRRARRHVESRVGARCDRYVSTELTAPVFAAAAGASALAAKTLVGRNPCPPPPLPPVLTGHVSSLLPY
jgi:hypothetical protein